MNRMVLQNSLQQHSRMQRSKKPLRNCLNERDGLALGICNGFQALIKLGLVPYGEIYRTDRGFSDTDLQHHRTSYLQDGLHKSCNKQIPMAGSRQSSAATYCNPASHGEGRFVAKRRMDQKTLCQRTGRNPVRGLRTDNCTVNDEEWNVNGSYYAIEGITSPDGRVLGKMAHAERRGDSVAINILRRAGYEDL